MELTRRAALCAAATLAAGRQAIGQSVEPVAIGSRRELFVDDLLIEELRDARLQLCTPVDAGPALRLDRPWEGAFSGYTTVVRDAGRLRLYYRGAPEAGRDGNNGEVTCCAESEDGIRWSRPRLSLFTVDGARTNNIVLAQHAPFSHNFTPLLDTNPQVASSARFKAIAGIHRTGLRAFVSEDGLAWRPLREQPVLPSPKGHAFDSQNIAFWSESEGQYVLYFRTWKRIGDINYRWVSRSTSPDFLNWSSPVEMDFGNAPPQHLYTNQTAPYFRAPHLYIGICARFFPGKQVVSEAQAEAMGVDPRYYKDCSDAVLLTSRGGNRYQRHYLEAFLRPGLGLENWVSRSNYPALNLVQTGPGSMSFYVNRNYGQPTAYLRRYELRLDGFASLHAGHTMGECVTRPVLFQGDSLELNFSTSAAGSIRVELQDAGGTPIPGYSLDEAKEVVGDEIQGVAAWREGSSVGVLQGKPVRIRIVLSDGDLYSFRFR